jgi:hypothetical protein
MNKTFSALFILVLSASALAAPALNPKILSRTQTVNDIKKISFPYKPIPVTAQSASGSTDTTTSTYTPSDKYSTGSGVILTPAYLVDAETFSTLALFNTYYDYTTQAQMKDPADPFATISLPPMKSTSVLFSSIAFRLIAKETHTYVLTLKIDKTATTPGHISIRIGSTDFHGNQVVYNSSTKEYRVLFSYTPLANQMNILVYYVNPVQTSNVQLNFHYAQLTQLD